VHQRLADLEWIGNHAAGALTGISSGRRCQCLRVWGLSALAPQGCSGCQQGDDLCYLVLGCERSIAAG
jgi:hypothetical protein